MNPYFAKGVTGALSDSISKIHDERLKKQQEEEQNAKALYTSLLQSGNPEVSAAGLAGLSELAGNPKAAKNALKITESFRKLPKHAEATQMISQIRDQQAQGEGHVGAESQAPPDPPPSYEMNMPPPVTSHSPEGAPEAPAGPPSPPPTMNLPAQNPSQQGTSLNLTPSAGMQAGPPEAPEEMSQRQQFFNQDPLAPRGAYTPELNAAARREASDATTERAKLADTTKRDLASGNWANRLAMTGLAHGNKMEEIQAQNTVPVLAQDAERYGLPEGSQVDMRLLSQLHADTRNMDSIAARKYAADRAGSGAIQAVFTGNYSPDGTPIMVYSTKQSLVGQEVLKTPGATEENRTKQAGRVQIGAANLQDELKNPEIRQQLGPSMGRFNNLRQWYGDADPALTEFKAHLESWLALQPALHGFRGINALEHFEKLAGAPITTPEALEAAIRGINKTAKTFTPNHSGGSSVSGEGKKADAAGAGAPPLPPAESRVVGQTYTLKNGKRGKWNGTGFVAVD